MLRRFLACLALISGLAAIGAPAHATLVEALDQLEVSAERPDRTKPAPTPCQQLQEERRQRGEKPAPCVEDRVVRILIPTVMFGPDRSLE